MRATDFPATTATDPVTRFNALAAETRAKLELALELTDFPSTVARAHTFLARLERAEASVAAFGNLGSVAAYAALPTWGRNGHGPEIDGLLSSARFHGRNWRAGFDAARAASRVGAGA